MASTSLEISFLQTEGDSEGILKARSLRSLQLLAKSENWAYLGLGP